jgi:hypothetical protein
MGMVAFNLALIAVAVFLVSMKIADVTKELKTLNNTLRNTTKTMVN